MIRQEDVRGRELLDIGGGIGAIQHELLREGLARAVHVDASTAYLAASAAEAERQGNRERVEYLHGDFVELVDDVPRTDIVTLDRVVCCYPDMPRLVAASASKTRRLYALSYPREHWGARTGLVLANLFFRVRGSEFRTYLHPPAEIEAQLRRQGLTPVARARTALWHVALYRRAVT